MILGVRVPLAGRIVLDDVTLFDASLGVDVAVERRRLGYVPQQYALFPNMTVIGNVEFAIACSDATGSRAARHALAEHILADLGLMAIARRSPSDLSGGEKQKVALARALAARPRALLLDEPLAALDAASRCHVRAFLGSYLRKLNLPALVITHDVRDAALLGDRIAVVDAGRIAQVGTWDELRAQPASQFVQQFASGHA
jgi:molybdate transport system ATP-binding protein